jgi:DNA-binding transcriptional LysR family regulator
VEDRALSYIKKILEEGSISQAAKRLFISQPSLSQFIQRLEEELGTELFDRTAKPLRLTAAGSIFLKTEQEIQRLREQRTNQIGDLFGLRKGCLIIGSSNYRSSQLLTRVLPLFKQRYPGINLSLEEGITEELEERAAEGSTDLSIVLLPLGYPDLAYEELFEEDILVALPAAHPLCGPAGFATEGPPYPYIDFCVLRDESFIVMKKGQKLRISFFDLCREAGIKPRIIMQTDSMATALALAAAGIGITIVPDALAASAAFPIPPRYFSLGNQAEARKVVVAYSRRRPLSGAARAFIEIMKEAILSA